MTHISRDTCRSQKIHTESPLLFMSGLWRSKEKLYPKKKQMLLCFLPEAEVSPHLFATIQWWIWKRNVSTFSNFILQAVWAIKLPFNYHHKRTAEGYGYAKEIFLGPHVLSFQCAQGISAKHSWIWQIHEHSLCFSAGSWLCAIYNLCHTPKDNTDCHTPNVHSPARAGTGKE